MTYQDPLEELSKLSPENLAKEVVFINYLVNDSYPVAVSVWSLEFDNFNDPVLVNR